MTATKRKIHTTIEDDDEPLRSSEASSTIDFVTTMNQLQSGLPKRQVSYSSTALSTLFYSQCALSGISSDEAENAITESKSWYHSWWRQERFKDEKDNNGSNDSTPLPNKRRKLQECSSAVTRNASSDNEIYFYNNNKNSSSLNKIDEETQSSTDTEDSNSNGSIELVPDDDVDALKNKVLEQLKSCGGDVSDETFLKHLSSLSEIYKSNSSSAPPIVQQVSEDGESSSACGAWVTLNKPHFQECLGRNEESGEYMYTLGRMSFDMFPERQLKCSIRGIFNIIEEVDPEEIEHEEFLLPSCLTKDKLDGILTYNISVAFTIEETGLKAVLTNYGFMLPDPNVPNRFSLWFTNGILEQDPESSDENEEEIPSPKWEETFGEMKRTLTERAKLLAARILLGVKAPNTMEEDGSMEYRMNRPIRGYCDVMYMDENLRIIKGHHGTIYVLYRIS